MADRTPVEVRLMIMDELLAIKIEENPQIHQVKIIQNSVTGVFNISFYGDTKQPNVLSIERYTREQAKKHYIKVFDRLPVGCQPSGGYWMRPKDIVYIDAQFSRGLHYIQRLNLGNITRVAIDVQVVDEDATGFESAMDKLMTFFPDIRHLVFFAPTQPNPVGNRYRGLRLVNELEDEVHKRLPRKQITTVEILLTIYLLLNLNSTDTEVMDLYADMCSFNSDQLLQGGRLNWSGLRHCARPGKPARPHVPQPTRTPALSQEHHPLVSQSLR